MKVLFRLNGKLLKANEIKAEEAIYLFFKPAKYILESTYPVKINLKE